MNLNKKHIVAIYCGTPESWTLPGDLLFVCLEIAGLTQMGRRHMRFIIYYPRHFVTAEGLRVNRRYRKLLARKK